MSFIYSMRVSHENITFQSRNKTIRFADDIARRVNTCFPRISYTKVSYFKQVNKRQNALNKLIGSTNEMRFHQHIRFDLEDSMQEKILSTIKLFKSYKRGNCGESTRLAAIVAKINGINNCHAISLVNTKGECLDHSVLYVKDKKNDYIIDAWLGFADYVPNCLNKYKTLYNEIFSVNDNEKITFATIINDQWVDFYKKDFSRVELSKVLKFEPNMIIEK